MVIDPQPSIYILVVDCVGLIRERYQSHHFDTEGLTSIAYFVFFLEVTKLTKQISVVILSLK